MARRLALLKKGDWDRFEQLLGAELLAEEVELLNEQPKILKDTLACMRRHPDYVAVMGPPVEPVDLTVNPREISVEETLRRLWAETGSQGWEVNDEDYVRLAATAPAWPKGRDAFRSLRIRWGTGDIGVALTFERHVAAIKHLHGEAKFWRWDLLRSDKKHLRLLNGNASHKPVIEWVIVSDLSANRKRTSVTDVRGAQSLADEGLVIAWLFPKRVEAIDYRPNGYGGWYCAGYEVNAPERDLEEWHGAVVVYSGTTGGKASVDADRRGSSHPGYSVPSVGSADPVPSVA